MTVIRSSTVLRANDYKTLLLAALGGALEFYDFIIFVYFATTLSELFFPAHLPLWIKTLQTFAIFAAGYLARPLGGIIMAHFGDKRGRKKMFSLSILLMAVPTLLMGLLPGYNQWGIAAPLLLLLCRIVQGAAIGGEVPGAWVFVSEHVPARLRGFGCATLTAGLAVGILLGSVVATVLNHLLSVHQVMVIGWRIAFIIGGALGLLALFLRKWLQETPVFIEMQREKRLAASIPVTQVFFAHKTELVLSVLLTWLLSATIVVLILMAPSLMQSSYGISIEDSLHANILANCMLFLGCLLAGKASDYFGPAPCLIVGSLLLAISSWSLFDVLAYHPAALFPVYALTGLCAGTVAMTPIIMIDAFPAPVRFTGISCAYNISYAVFGGLTPIFISLLIHFEPELMKYYLPLICLIGVLAGYCLIKRNKLSNNT